VTQTGLAGLSQCNFEPLRCRGVVLLIALLALSPEGDTLIPALELIGIAGLIYSMGIVVKAARSNGLFSDAWLFHGGASR